jgi:hypothetical protein
MPWTFYDKYGQRRAVYTATPGATTYGTTLPGSPLDGQEFTLVDSTTAATYQWKFRYNAGSSSSLKWECVGGVPFQNRVDTQENTASGTYVALTTVGPTFTAPRSGDYLVDFGFQAIAVAAGPANTIGGLFLNGVDQSINVQQTLAGSGAGNVVTASARKRIISATVGDVLTMRYFVSNSVNTGFFQRNFQVIPIRVS